MRLGLLLPTFRRSPEAALAAAHEAAAAGLDGVFAYDHVWPMGAPERPAIAPFEVLATVAVAEPSLRVGPLVARVGLVEPAVLASQLRALAVAADGRVVAALGTGDRKSVGENLAYGVPVAEPDERRSELRGLASQLLDEGLEVWIGDGAPATREIAVDLGCTLNLWQRGTDEVAQMARRCAVSWAGAPPRVDGELDEAQLAAQLGAIAAAGATWAVLSPSVPAAMLARCAVGLRGT